VAERAWKRSRSASAPKPVRLGSHVLVELVTARGEHERLAFDIVPDDQADLAAGFLAVNSRLAQAILGQNAGSVVPYRVEDVCEVRVLSVADGQRLPPQEIAANRQAIIQKAVSNSDLENAVRFALSVDVKWGETDPEGIAGHWD